MQLVEEGYITSTTWAGLSSWPYADTMSKGNDQISHTMGKTLASLTVVSVFLLIFAMRLAKRILRFPSLICQA